MSQLLDQKDERHGKWKLYFDYWVKCAGAADHLEWYIFANIHKNLQTTPFYNDLIVTFKNTGGKLLCNFTSIWETMEVPLWNNVKVTRDESLLNSPLLKSFGCFNVGDVVWHGELFSYHDIAKMCGIENINAGRILGRIEKHINYTLIHEKREGPAAHTSNWLVICDHKTN